MCGQPPLKKLAIWFYCWNESEGEHGALLGSWEDHRYMQADYKLDPQAAARKLFSQTLSRQNLRDGTLACSLCAKPRYIALRNIPVPI